MLKGRSDSVSLGSLVVHKVLLEPSKHLQQVWSLSLNVILLLLPSCRGFSFALGHAISSHSRSSTVQPSWIVQDICNLYLLSWFNY